MASKEVTDSTIFWLFLASFIMATLKEALLQGLSDKQVRDEIVTDFYIDFMYGFSYVEQKAHTVLELKRGAKRIVKKIREAIENSDTLFQRYWLLKDELSFRGFDFDVRMPKPRYNYRGIFGKSWDSLIIIAFPEAAKSYRYELVAPLGAVPVTRRLASILYIEIMISRDNDIALLVINRPLSKLERYEDRELSVIKTILAKLLELNYDAVYHKSKKYEVSAESFLKDINEVLRAASRRKLSSMLLKSQKRFKDKLVKTIERAQLQYKNELQQLASKLMLSRVYVKIRLEKRDMLSIDIWLAPPKCLSTFNDISLIAENVKRTINSAINFYSIKELVPLKFGVRLRSIVNDEEVEVEFDSDGNVYFHNLRRDYATELSYVLSKVLKK